LVADKSADSLYDEGRRARERGAALFNMPIDLRSDLVFHVLVRVTTDDGLTGLGAIGLGSRAMADAVERLLAPLVLGRNPFDVELLWELIDVNPVGGVTEARKIWALAAAHSLPAVPHFSELP
jgi:L-alanine-DL-glutamate epimerase-like enolase superfamily enzyme